MELQDAVLQSMELAEDPDVPNQQILAAEQQLFELYDTTEFETEAGYCHFPIEAEKE